MGDQIIPADHEFRQGVAADHHAQVVVADRSDLASGADSVRAKIPILGRADDAVDIVAFFFHGHCFTLGFYPYGCHP